MIGTSLWNLIFIRFCIISLHYITPLSLLYCSLLVFIHPLVGRIPPPFEIWIVAEALFFISIYLPRYYILQNAAIHPPTRSRENRRALFQLCNKSVEDPERYLSMWFKGAVRSEIRRENVKEFFSWAFLNKPSFGVLDEEELEEYTDQMEFLLGRKFQPGKGNASSLRLTTDKVKMLHRSLLWYMVSPLQGMTKTATNLFKAPQGLIYANIMLAVCLCCRYYHLRLHALQFISLSSLSNQTISNSLSIPSNFAFNYPQITSENTDILASPPYFERKLAGTFYTWYRYRALPLYKFFRST